MSRSSVITAMLAVAVLTSVMPAQTALLEREPAGAYPWMPIEGSDVMWARWEEGASAWYAVSLDGGVTARTVRAADDEVRLRYATFDPLTDGEPAMTAALRATSGKLWIVQYATRGIEPYRDLVEARGGEILWFIPGSCDLVRMDERAVAAVSELPFVRWVGRYHTAYRIDAETRDRILAGDAVPAVYNVNVTVSGPAEKAAVAAHVEALGGTVADYVSPHGYLMQVTLPPRDLLEIVRRDDVLFSDPWSPEEGDLDIVRQFNGADYIETAGGYTGQGVRAEVRDIGLQTDHPNLQRHPAIPHGPNPPAGSHGTGVYGICFGSGDDNAQARGVMPDAQGIINNVGSLPDRFIATGELLQAPYRCVFQTNSTGSTQTPNYTTISADMDNILFAHDVCVTQSQSNMGNQNSRPQAWAKNMISVGGIRHHNTLTEVDDEWDFSGSIGPAADGRIKPDISAFYDSTLSTTTGGGYQQFGGTSGATPICAAHLGLIHQMWADGLFGNSLVNWDVFDNKPSAALAKALLLNSTTQYTFSGSGHDLTRVHQGWGRPDVKKCYDRANRLVWIDESIVLGNMQMTSLLVTVPSGQTEFRATLVYRDPPGGPMSAMHRINDVTLRVVDPMGTVYFGNNGLLTATTSSPGGTANVIDTVEQVIVTNPPAGAWTVEVTASELNQDGHVATPQLDVVFGLAVSGVLPPPPPPPTPGQPNTALGSMGIVNSLNANGQKPKIGNNGPFVADLTGGDSLTFEFEGPPGREFLLFHGPLGVGNGAFGVIGNLDVGQMGGSGSFSDISLLLDGVNGPTFFDSLAAVGSDGRQTLGFTIPASLPPGSLGAFQALFWDVSTAQLSFTAACEVNVQ